MPTEIVLPKVDNDMTEGKITRWFVKDEGRVARGDPLFEIETDKAAMEVEAPVAGTVWGIVSPEGGRVPVGSTVAWISQEGEPSQARTTPADQTKPSRVEPGNGPEPAPAEPESGARKDGQREAAIAKNVPATPLARRLARQRGIDLRHVIGSGPHGRIQRRDLPETATLSAVPSLRREPGTPSRGVSGRGPAESDSSPIHREWLRTGEGPPLVLVHGFGSELAIWRPLVSRLGLSSPILALDLPGHGRSPALRQAGFDALVSTMEAALADEGVGRADLVGHSLGGAIATAIATRGCIEPRSLFLIAPAGLGPDINGAFLAGFSRAQTEASLGPWMRLLVSDPSLIGDALITRTLHARSTPGAVEALEELTASLFPNGTQSFSIRELLGRLAVPTRVVFGASDRIIPVEHGRGLPGRVALHVFTAVGHMPHLEDGIAVADLLRDTIRGAT